jgi:LmbE family N-acetylglucosaminyl deacetylase
MKNLLQGKRWHSIVVVAFLATFAFTLYFFFFIFTPASYTKAEEVKLPTFPELKSTDRITVVAPHLDDEGLGVGGLVAEASQRNIPVSVIFMTNGDGNYYGTDIQDKTLRPSRLNYVDYGKTRQYEALTATKKLGISSKDVYFLGLPDRGVESLLSSQYFTHPYTSPYTGQSTSPYDLTYAPHLPYTGQSAQSALTQAINQTQPTILFAPLLQDKHPDHSATGKFVKKIMPNITSHPHTYLYLVHFPKYPLPRGINPTYPLLPPQKLASLSWETIPLPTEIVELKRQSVESYVTQIKIPEVGHLLRSLVRRNELVVDGF